MARNRGIPHYQRVLADLLATGRPLSGGALPSERALAARYGVARGTARRALEELRALGYVHRVQGAGTYATRQTGPVVHFIGYHFSFYEPHFCRPLRQHLEAKGVRLVATDMGHQGELLPGRSTLRADLSAAELVVWYASSHYLGREAAVRFRRKLPAKLPMILIGDALGLSLQSSHRFDLLHFDNASAARNLVALLVRRGIYHPVFVRHPRVRLFSTEETERGFLCGLMEHGVAEPGAHLFDWQPEESRSLLRFMQEPRAWAPQAFILGFPYKESFRASCACSPMPYPDDIPLLALGSEEGETLRMSRDYAQLAAACADLVFSRMERPKRPNTHTTVAMPVRSRKRATPG